MESETLYLLGSLDGDEVKPADFPVSASCHRVAVVDGHTEAVFLELDEDVDIFDLHVDTNLKLKAGDGPISVTLKRVENL